MSISVFLAALIAVPAAWALVYADGTGKLPALGWNSWNAFACDISESKILTAANAIVSLGLKDVGYEYVNIDDCWSTNERDSVTGELVPDPVKFPNGIIGLAEQIHALGLKLGIYGSAGTETCAGYPAQIGHESLDASTFASWGIDYLKYDNCFVPANWTDPYTACVPDGPGNYPNGTCPDITNPAPPGYDWGTSNTAKRYNVMRDALLAQNRTIFYSLCEWGQAAVQTWGANTASSWRVTGDITPYWYRVAEILNENSFLLDAVGFWGHNDVDMLEIGNGNLTIAESRSHFAFWAAMKSPLIIGTALDIISPDLQDILKNEALLAFHQDDTFGSPAKPYQRGDIINTFNATYPAEYWSGISKNGVLVLALNAGDSTQLREIIWSEVPELKGGDGVGYEVTDIWTSESLGCVTYGEAYMVEPHDTVGFLVGQQCSLSEALSQVSVQVIL